MHVLETAEEAGFDQSGLDQLKNFLDREIAAGIHDGSVTVVGRAGAVGLIHATGTTDITSGRQASVDDVFLTMSLSKSFCAALVLRLIDRGELAFDTKVADVIPEFAAKGKGRVTIAHLLTHSGGTWSGFVPPPPLAFAQAFDHALVVATLCDQPLVHEPGARVVYNPFASYSILGEVVVRLDSKGRSYPEIAREEIFTPLGMDDSSYGLAVDDPRRVPVRMAERIAGAASVDTMESLNSLIGADTVFPAGGAFSTATDVFRFADALRQGGSSQGYRLLSRPMVSYAYRNHTGDLPNDFWDFNREMRSIENFPANFTYGGGYARGTGDHLTPLGRLASSQSFGAVGSGSTMWMVDPERELTVVFLAAGLTEGLGHFQRMQRINDLALAALV